MFPKVQNRPRRSEQHSAGSENLLFRDRHVRSASKQRDALLMGSSDDGFRNNMHTPSPKQKAQNAARSRKRGFVVTLALFGMAACVAIAKVAVDDVILGNPSYVLRCVKVDTKGGLLTEDEISLASGVQPGSNIYTLDVAHITERLERLPALRKVEVNRDNEGRLLIVAHQRVPVAWVKCESQRYSPTTPGGALLVDADGAAIPVPVIHGELAHLPVIEDEYLEKILPGEVLRSERFRAALHMLLAMQQRNHLVTKITVDKNYALEVYLGEGPKVTFAWDDYAAELPRFDYIMQQAQQQRWALQTVNVINDKHVGVTFRPKRSTSQAPPAAIPVRVSNNRTSLN